MQGRPVQAEENSPNTLPSLGQPSESPGTFNAGPNGATLDNRFDGKRLVISPEYGNQNNFSLGGSFAVQLGESAAGGVVVNAGNQKKELLFNLGLQVDESQRFIFNLGQMRQLLGFSFISGLEKVEMTQNNAAVSYQFRLMQGALNSAEINGYYANTPSRDITDRRYARDTATFYELWNDPRRVAGGRVTGLQGRLAFTPMSGSTLKLGAGGEQLEYDYLTGKQRTSRATGSVEWIQQLAGGIRLNAGADAAVQNRYTLGMESPLGEGWLFGVNFISLHGRNGAPGDKRLNLVWKYDFDGKHAATGSNHITSVNGTPTWGSLIDEVSKRPAYLPAQVVAKVDTTAVPLRLIDVNKAALPAGSSVNVATGVVTTPLGIAVTGIAGVTLNGAAFANTGQFAVSGNNLVTDPGKIVQPAIGVIDTYVITVNNLGGGTTLVTVLVSHGSVKIDGISIVSGVAPVAPVAPAVTANDVTNTVTGMATGMEYSLDGAAYVAYNAATFNAISFAGVHTLLVRVAAAGINPAGAITTLSFTTNPVTPAAPSVTADDTANTVAGMAIGMEYSLDGAAYVAYNAATFNAISFAGVHTLLVRVAAAGINPAGAITTLSFTTNPVTPAAPSVTADDTANTVAGMATGMEYSLDGAAYVAYNAATFNAISFAGIHTLLVRVAAAGGNPASAITTLSFTTNAAAPTASAVSISGTAQVGQLLTGSYTYADVDSDPQGTSTFRWLRNGVAITGAMASTYTLVAADQGNTITFEVTPVSTVAPTTGTPVLSSATAVVAAANTAPTANNFTYGTNIDNVAKTFSWLVLSAAADANGDPLTATVQEQGAKGTFVVSGNNVTYTPSANQTVSDSGTLRISDGRGGIKDITVTVNGIDTQPPAAPTGLALNTGAASTSTAVNGSLVTLDGLSTPADADLAAWFVSESTSAPAAGAAGWSSTNILPGGYVFATATNETKTVCVFVKDTLGNVQPTGACDTIVKVP